MPTSRYESRKPGHQKHAHGSQPPMHSVAVFAWETFTPLADYTEQSLFKVLKQISRDIIERPYHYDQHKAFDAQGNLVNYDFTPAGNVHPPKKIPGIAVYKQNHGTGHALRQMIYTKALIDTIAREGVPKSQSIAQTINSNPEIKSALMLAAYCKRIGRTLDHEKDEAKPNPSIYSVRSAEMFAQIAKELGYNPDLIRIISDGMLEPTPKDPGTLSSYASIAGIKGSDLRYFTENVLMSAHMADLVRLFSVKRAYIENSLKYHFEPQKLSKVFNGLVEMACTANTMTGNSVRTQEAGIEHRTCLVNGKRLVEVVTHLDQAMHDLSKLQLLPLDAGVRMHPAAAAFDIPVPQQQSAAAAFDTPVPQQSAAAAFDAPVPRRSAAAAFDALAPRRSAAAAFDAPVSGPKSRVNNLVETKGDGFRNDALEPLSMHPLLDALDGVPGAVREQRMINNNYAYKAYNNAEGRYHFFSASVSSSMPNNMQQAYGEYYGDRLKTAILNDFRLAIQNTGSKENLAALKNDIMGSDEYKILKTGQGFFTKITGIKTSSVEALEDMLKQKEENLDNVVSFC